MSYIEHNLNIGLDLCIGREIRVVAFHEISEEVAVVDESIGYTEVLCRSLDKAYLAFYRSHRARCVLFGPGSASAKRAADYVSQVRYSCGTRFVAAVEVQDKARSLMAGDEGDQYEEGASDLFLAQVIAALDDEGRAVYTLVDLKDFVLSCVEEIARNKSNFLERIAPIDASTSTVANAVFLELMEPMSSEDFARIFRQQTFGSNNQSVVSRGGLGREGEGSESDCESYRGSVSTTMDPVITGSTVRPASSLLISTAQAAENEKERAVVRQKLREDAQFANTVSLRKKSLVADPGPSYASDTGNAQKAALPKQDDNAPGPSRQQQLPDQTVELPDPAPASSGTSSAALPVPLINAPQSVDQAPSRESVPTASQGDTQSPSNTNASSNISSKATSTAALPRLGARPLLLVQDAEGKPGVLRAAAASDVLEAFQMRIFSAGIFAHLLSGAKVSHVILYYLLIIILLLLYVH
jgi:hypothetical protein